MKLNEMGRAAMASMLSLAIGLGVTACSRDYTVAYLYVTSAKNTPHGLVNGYKVDYQTGALTALADSPVDSGSKNPVMIVAAPNGRFLYVIHRDDSDVVEFSIGTDGKIYPQTTYNTTGSFPLDAAIDPDGKFLYVVFTYQNGPDGQELYTPASPGPGGVTIFPINADNSLGTPTTANVGRSPVGITVSNNHFVYVIAQDSATTANLFGFSADPTTGMLTPLPGVTINSGNVPSTGFPSGVTPSGIIVDSGSLHLYVTDQAANQIIGYSVASNGVPSLLPNGSAQTGAAPAGMTIDQSGKYLYLVNYTAGTIGGYTFGPNGEPIPSTVAGSVQAGTGPTCVTLFQTPSSSAPAYATYLYTSNALGNSVTGEQMIPQNGGLNQIQDTPFSAAALPTCIVSVAATPQ